MSLELLKERFNAKPMVSEYQEDIENKEQIIQNLENENFELSNKVISLEKENQITLQKLNEANHFEDGVFSIKEKEYQSKLELKNRVIKEVKLEVDELNLKIDKKQSKIFHKDEVIQKSSNIIKQLSEKINKLNYRLTNEKKINKETIDEINEKKKETYQEYLNNLDTYENAIVSRNNTINEYKNKLNDSLNKLKQAKTTIDELNSYIERDKNIREELRDKKDNILNLKEQINILSKENKSLSELSYKNSVLESKLEKAENFQIMVNNEKTNYDKLLKQSNNLNVFSLIGLLKETCKQKQGSTVLTWKKWLEIPESRYLLQIDETMAKSVFNENNDIINNQRISLQANQNSTKGYTIGEGDKADERNIVLKTPGLLSYHFTNRRITTAADKRAHFPKQFKEQKLGFATCFTSGSAQASSSVGYQKLNRADDFKNEITLWKDSGPKNNHLIAGGDEHNGNTSGKGTYSNPGWYTNNGAQFYRNPYQAKGDSLNFKNSFSLDEFTIMFVADIQASVADAEDSQHNQILSEITTGEGGATGNSSKINLFKVNSDNFIIYVTGDDGTTTDTANLVLGEGTVGQSDGPYLFTITLSKHNGTSKVAKAYVDKVLRATDDSNYTADVPLRVDRVGNNNATNGFHGFLTDLAIYDRVLTDKELDEVQDFFMIKHGL